MLMQPFLLLVIRHTLHIAFLLHLRNNLIHILFNVFPHTFDLLQSFLYLSTLYLTDLTAALGLVLKELKVLISDITDVFHHLGVKGGNVLFLMLEALANVVKVVSFSSVILL